MSEEQIATWTISKPVTPEYTAIQQFTNPSCTTTKHRKDSPERRMKRDAADLDEVSPKPVARSPF